MNNVQTGHGDKPFASKIHSKIVFRKKAEEIPTVRNNCTETKTNNPNTT